MGIDLQWEDEEGTRVAGLPDSDGLVKRILPDHTDATFPWLRFVDLYGDTIFNQLQVPQLITELEVLLRQRHEASVHRHLVAMLVFARQSHGNHMYLRFYGD